MRYAVTGATGELGRLVVSSLLTRVPAASVVALVRDPLKAEDLVQLGIDVRPFDYDEPASLAAALRGIDRLLLISSSARGRRVVQHQAVIDAARQSGVALLLYTSTLRADTSPLQLAAEHRETEALIHASGLDYVILRNNWYTENYTAQIPNALRMGFVLGAAGKGRVASASRADFAEGAAAALTAENPLVGQMLELAGDQSYSLHEFAEEVSRQSGQSITYRDVSPEEYEGILLGLRLPTDLAALLADSDKAAAQGAMDDSGRALSRLIGRPTTPLSQSVTEALRNIAGGTA